MEFKVGDLVRVKGTARKHMSSGRDFNFGVVTRITRDYKGNPLYVVDGGLGFRSRYHNNEFIEKSGIKPGAEVVYSVDGDIINPSKIAIGKVVDVRIQTDPFIDAEIVVENGGRNYIIYPGYIMAVLA